MKKKERWEMMNLVWLENGDIDNLDFYISHQTGKKESLREDFSCLSSRSCR